MDPLAGAVRARVHLGTLTHQELAESPLRPAAARAVARRAGAACATGGRGSLIEPAVFSFNLLSATGTTILIAAIVRRLCAWAYKPGAMARVYLRTLRITWRSLVTIVRAMMSIGYLTRYSGLDAILGLAFARTGVMYPLFGTLLGWLGVALTGSDTSSNALFGSLQTITARRLGLSPVLMAAANSSGGVMGKMIDSQSIVVASTATRWYGHEGKILRFVFFHSLILAVLVGLLVLLQAYVAPFTSMVPG